MRSFPTDSSFYSTLRVFPDFVQDLARDGAPSATALYRCANMIHVEKSAFHFNVQFRVRVSTRSSLIARFGIWVKP